MPHERFGSPGVLRVACAQIENRVGDLDGNARAIRAAMEWAEERAADVLVLPELALTGYPLADLALRPDFVDASLDALAALARDSGSTATVLSTIDRVPPRRGRDTQHRSVAIGAALLCDGEVRGMYHKVLLPTYETFEEGRYFAAGDDPGATWRIGAAVVGVSICEDAWSDDGPPEAQAAAGAQILLVPNASPFHRGKPGGRLDLVRRVARRNGVPYVYVNSVGGQDDLVFDGGSLVVDGRGEPLYRARQFEPETFVLDVPVGAARPLPRPPGTVHARIGPPRAAGVPPPSVPELPELEQVWRALVVGTRDFVLRAGFAGAVVALSGGIDSAITAAVAADALGPGAVLALAMPGETTPASETETARAVAESLGIELRVIPIRDLGGDELVGSVVGGVSPPVAEDLDARARGAVLMATAEALGRIALATGNKTELSIGAGVLFGDMVGGFSPLRDCPKTLLYDLARHRNRAGGAIPAEVTASPTLRDRTDQLPPYAVLDAIVERYVERGESLDEIVAAGFDASVTRGVLQLVDDAELKRRLIAPGVKVTARAFASDRRMPIVSAWRPFRADELELLPAAEPVSGEGSGR